MIIIKESKIHGKGVFASKQFKKDEVVLTWNTPIKLTKNQVNELPVEERRYVTSLDKDIYILLQVPERHVNHSCSPNVGVNDYCDVALRDIEEGEEITADYSKEFIPNLVLKCNCQSRNCRRIIHGGKNVW